MDTNLCHTLPLPQKIAICIQLQNLELVQLSFTIWPQQWWYVAATMEERALCIYGFRVVLRFCRQLFSSVKYFCGFLQLFTSFQYFIFIVQISFTNENLYISAGTKEEIVRTKVENKLQWVHLSFILEISFVFIIIQQHDSASVLFLSLSRACNLPSHVFRQLARHIQVWEGQRYLFVTIIARIANAVPDHNLYQGMNVCEVFKCQYYIITIIVSNSQF